MRGSSIPKTGTQNSIQRIKEIKAPKTGHQKRFGVTAEDLEKELPEPRRKELDSSDLAVNVILEPIEPDRKRIAQFGNDIFKSAEYWCGKGYKMQTGKSSNENLNKHLKPKNTFGPVIKVKVKDESD